MSCIPIIINHRFFIVNKFAQKKFKGGFFDCPLAPLAFTSGYQEGTFIYSPWRSPDGLQYYQVETSKKKNKMPGKKFIWPWERDH
jgi:hypothetical protein